MDNEIADSITNASDPVFSHPGAVLLGSGTGKRYIYYMEGI